MNKKIIIIIFCTIITIFTLFIIFHNKTINIGNNTKEEIEEELLKITEYEALITVTIQSNKNSNTYVLKQKYVDHKYYYQEVLEPANIKGLITEFDGTNIKISNTQLNLSKIFNNYQVVTENNLLLECFIQDYKEGTENKIEETETEIIFYTKSKNTKNKYFAYKTLHIDRKTKKPTKMIIQDINANEKVYILYNEIKIM